MNKKICTAAGAVALLTGSVFAAGGNVELRIIKLNADTGNPATNELAANTTGGEVLPGAGAYSCDFYLQARVVNDPLANGISAFDANLSDGGAGGTFTALGLSFSEQGVVFPGSDFIDSMDNGMFENFRATIQADNSNPGNGGSGGGVPTEVPTGSELNLLPLDLAQGGRGEGEGVWINVYKFNYSNPNVDGTVAVAATSTGQGYWDDSTLVQLATNGESGNPAPIVGGYTIEIPAPGAAALACLGGLAAFRRRR